MTDVQTTTETETEHNAEEPGRPGTGSPRRLVLLGAGAVGATAVLAACGTSTNSTNTNGTDFSNTPAPAGSGAANANPGDTGKSGGGSTGGSALATTADVPQGSGSRVIGFATAGRARGGEFGRRLGEGEVETLYVLDDWRDRGVGRRLMRAAAANLAEIGCRSCFLWVLRDNPSRWFYQRLGGKPVAEAVIQFAGQSVPQTAFVWDPIERLLAASPQES